MSNSSQIDVVVVGGGIFGCLTAIELSKNGMNVTLIEMKKQIMKGASLNNQNRLHLGYHYPRDLETAIQCQRGFSNFKERFSECILENFENIYLISKDGSNVNYSEYMEFCTKASLPVDEINIDTFEPNVINVIGGLYTDEVVYDSSILSNLVLNDLDEANVDTQLGSKVKSISQEGDIFEVQTESKTTTARAIVNCTYANFNDFNLNLGVARKKLQYELTVVPEVEWRRKDKPIGITVMDGKFFTILPFGKTGKYLLYHVDHTVQDTFIGFEYPSRWRDPRSIIKEKVARAAFQKMITSSSNWLPEITNAKYVDYLAAVRVVLADVEITDRRPSLINKLPIKNPFYTVFSGKIDHSIWVATEISERILRDLQ